MDYSVQAELLEDAESALSLVADIRSEIAKEITAAGTAPKPLSWAYADLIDAERFLNSAKTRIDEVETSD